MIPGWKLQKGEMRIGDVNCYIERLEYFFSKGNRMTNLYKLVFFKSVLELENIQGNIFYDVVINFAKIYYEYRKKYPVTVMIFNGNSLKSSVDTEIEKMMKNQMMDYREIDDEDKINYVLEIKNIVKRNVIGAVYENLGGVPYSFDIRGEKIVLNGKFKEFLDKNKKILKENIELRIIELLKITEKNSNLLKEILLKQGIYYEDNFYEKIKIGLKKVVN